MEFNLLGPLEAVDGMVPLTLGGPKSRALLSRLLLDANRTVSVQRLVDDLWGEKVPESAVKMVQIHVSQLRKTLPEGVLLTRPPGYVVDVDPEAVDVTRFNRLRDEGRAAMAAGDPAGARARLGEALALWRGPALAEFAEPFAAVEAAHLEELRIVCLQERIDADLALGRHADVVGELEALVARHPLREALHGRLMLALYRTGRQADALAVYDRFRRTLDEELGIEPSGVLKQLHFSVLNQSPELELGAGDAPGALRLPPEAQPAGAAAEDGLVGRAQELGRLEAALGAAGQMRGSAVLVTGRAGIGKTRLTAALAERARRRGASVLSGRCIQLVGSGLPYLPLVDALRPLRGSEALGTLSGELRELPRLVPDLGGAPGTSEPTRGDSRLRLFEEVLAVLEHLAADQPLVLLIEDLHWADESTLDLVTYLAYAVRDRRILLVATYRSDEVLAGDHLHRLAAGLVGAGVAESLPLEPLGRDELEALLAAVSGRRLPAGLVETIASRSEGNPFFARELLAAASRGETALPPALREVLLSTIACLDADSRSVLRVAAAAGRDVQYGLLAAVMPLGELELAEALREAVEHDVLAPDQAAGTFRFRHELFAEAVYATLLPGEREVVHERLARALTEEPRLAASAGTAAEAAHHWVAAGRPVEALAASLEAAREAEAVSGLTEALRHVERVLELWDKVPVAEEVTGVALPTVVAWAAELAGVSAHQDETDATAPLTVTEARRLYPSVVVLESLAVRVSPRFDLPTLDAMRAANARFRASSHDPVAASAADDEFHVALTSRCKNEHLLAALRPVKQALLRYERVYMDDPARIERSATEHDGIIEALERGDHAEAAQRVRENMSGGLPALRDAIEP